MGTFLQRELDKGVWGAGCVGGEGRGEFFSQGEPQERAYRESLTEACGVLDALVGKVWEWGDERESRGLIMGYMACSAYFTTHRLVVVPNTDPTAAAVEFISPAWSTAVARPRYGRRNVGLRERLKKQSCGSSETHMRIESFR